MRGWILSLTWWTSWIYSALPWQNRLTDIFRKTEFLPLIGLECQYLPMKNVKHVNFTILNTKKIQLEKWVLCTSQWEPSRVNGNYFEFFVFIYFIYSRYKKADLQPKAEKHRFYKQKHKYMNSKLFSNIQAIENTWKAKYIQKSSTSHKQINLKIIIEHMNYIRNGWILKPVGFAQWRWKPIALS